MTRKELRLRRLFNTGSGRSVIAAFTHSMLSGPRTGVGTNEEWAGNIAAFARGGADAVMISPGYTKAFASEIAATSMGVVVSVDWSDIWRGPDQLGHKGFVGDHTLMTTVESAVSYGADAVHMYMFLGSDDSSHEVAQVARVGKVVTECDRLGIPLLLEPLARGTMVAEEESSRLDYVQLVTRIGADIGADLVKVEYTGSVESFRQVVDVCAVPVLVMGGAPTSFDEFLQNMADATASGGQGAVAGRNVFLTGRTEENTRRLRETIDGASQQ